MGEKQRREQARRLAGDAVDIAADHGEVVRVGWLACRKVLLEGKSEQELDEFRRVYYAGSEHLFSSLMSVLDSGREPTERDLRRMSAIYDELVAYRKEMEGLLMDKPAGSA